LAFSLFQKYLFLLLFCFKKKYQINTVPVVDKNLAGFQTLDKKKKNFPAGYHYFRYNKKHEQPIVNSHDSHGIYEVIKTTGTGTGAK
jgi:hypothetical protein